jgi:hypothetical protein
MKPSSWKRVFAASFRRTSTIIIIAFLSNPQMVRDGLKKISLVVVAAPAQKFMGDGGGGEVGSHDLGFPPVHSPCPQNIAPRALVCACV